MPVKEDDRVSRLKDPEGGVQTEEGVRFGAGEAGLGDRRCMSVDRSREDREEEEVSER